MSSIPLLLLGLVSWFGYKLWQWSRSPLRFFPGPPVNFNPRGNLKDIGAADPGVRHEGWRRKYGDIFLYRGNFLETRLCIFDKRALTQILITEPQNFPKSEAIRRALGSILGAGVLFAEGDIHTRQRKIMNPSFGPVQIRALTPIIVEKAAKMHSILWSKLSEKSDEEGITLDMLQMLSRTTLDVIGSAGFGYEIDSLDESKSNELASSFATMMRGLVGTPSFLTLARLFIPILSFIPDRSQRGLAASASMATMTRIGRQLLADKKRNVILDSGASAEGIQKHQMTGKDLLSVLVKANMANDLKDSQKLSDDEVLGQITTFLVAGNETTSSATSWTLHALCTNPTIQDTLRKEIRSQLPNNNPSMEDLNSLPYLDAVVRETLRVYSPVAGTARIAAKNSVIPLSKPYTDTKGVVHHELRIEKGTGVFVPILTMSVDEEIWGDDSHQFRPERWLAPNLPEGVQDLPSIHSPTFLAGSRACIGYRFAIVEMKAILVALVRDIAFDWADPSIVIGKKSGLVTRPIIVGRLEEGHQLPLRLRVVRE